MFSVVYYDFFGCERMKGIMMMTCPSCAALYYLHGDFGEDEGQIVRASDTPYENCDKCVEIAKVCGFE